MLNESEYNEAKKIIRWLEERQSEAAGAYKSNLKTLKKKFKCESIDAAEKKLSKLKRKVTRYEEEFNANFRKFKKKFKREVKEYQKHSESVH